MGEGECASFGDYGKKNTPLNQVGGSSAEKDYNTLLTHPYYIPNMWVNMR